MHYKEKKIIIGLMSGTSLDGLDIALSSYEYTNGSYEYKLINAKTVFYPDDIKHNLKHCHQSSPFDFISFHKEYGRYLGKKINEFLIGYDGKVDCIGSHGHTVFHRPEEGITFQIGDGAAIAGETGISVISDFRNLDVCLGGQGAPLVPIGDLYLFKEFEFCLNLGGFANISWKVDNGIVAFDICPANLILNYYAGLFGQDYDNSGNIGRSGEIDYKLLDKLNSIEFYHKLPPKSLGREWLEDEFLPSIGKDTLPRNIIRTLYEHISFQISKFLNVTGKKVLVTGGGAHNDFLMELLRTKSVSEIIIPDEKLVDFKEAIVFGFLAYLYINQENSCLSQVTGSSVDNVGGCLFNGRK